MTKTMRQWILRANAIFLLAAGTTGLLMDVLANSFARGPFARLVSGAPYMAIGTTEAHGLALILGVLLWRAVPVRSWHLTAVAVHVLLGTANLVFWQVFVAADFLAAGYITTSLHGLFVVLELSAATAASRAGALDDYVAA